MMELDEHQHAAATAPESRVLVTACPGSGKSRTLVARVEHLVRDRAVPPSLIACITFTNYAAGVLRDRLSENIGRRAYIGTFHAFALMLVKMYGTERGYEGHWLTILDPAEVELEERSILRDFGLINSRGHWSRCTKQEWEEWRNEKVNGLPHARRVDDGETISEPTVYSDFRLVWREFMDRLRAENVLTFGTMVLEAVALLKIPDIREKVRKRYRHILVDESQDSDGVQWELLRLLDPGTIFVVGDGDQAIYGWRGARPDLFIDYANDPTVARYDLPRSYRFGFNIAEPANELIKHNAARLDTAITAIAENEGAVQVVRDVQVEQLAQIIRDELKNYAPRQLAVLARRHSTLDQLAQVLDAEKDIPFTQIGGAEDIPKTAAFRAVRGYLRLAVNPKDSRAFMAISAAEGLGTTWLLELRSKANEEKVSLLEAFGHELPKDLGGIQARLHDKDPMTDYLPAIKYMQGVMFTEAITEVQELLEYLALETLQDRMRSKDDTVVLITAHGAKGLEWDVVFVVGLNANQWPSPRSIREGRLEESRRLLYVAMTRAKEKLYLCQHLIESVDDGPSMFWDELGSLPEAERPEEDNLVFT